MPSRWPRHILFLVACAWIFPMTLGAVPVLPLQFTPAAVVFPVTTLGETSAALNATIRLRAGAEPFGPIHLQLSDPHHFRIVSDTCSGVTLQADGGCEVSAVFSPDVFGHYSSFLVFLDAGDSLGNFIPLEGIGAESGFAGPPPTVSELTTVSLSSDTIMFGSLNPGEPSAPQSVTLINTGSADLRVQATTFGGDAPFNFARIDSCAPRLVPPGGTCTVTAFFTPLSQEPGQAALAIMANTSESPILIELSGNGAGIAASGGGCSLAALRRENTPSGRNSIYSALVTLLRARLQ